MVLTKKQQRLADEVTYLLDVLQFPPDLGKFDRSSWTFHLESSKRSLVATAVLHHYLVIDACLDNVIYHEFFPRGRSIAQLASTARFVAFNYFMLERLYLVQKVQLARTTTRMPTKLYKDLLALNELRNAVAHSLYPEKRRVQSRWKGVDIYSRDGFDHFWDDMCDAVDFFVRWMQRSYRFRQGNQRTQAK